MSRGALIGSKLRENSLVKLPLGPIIRTRRARYMILTTLHHLHMTLNPWDNKCWVKRRRKLNSLSDISYVPPAETVNIELSAGSGHPAPLRSSVSVAALSL